MASSKMNSPEVKGLLNLAKVVLLDIEGTTTSISFVKDTLFPYARDNIETYLKANWKDNSLQELVAILRSEAEEESKTGAPSIPSAENSREDVIQGVMSFVFWLMDKDSKTTALKELQGRIWKDGYNEARLVSHIFDDVALTISRWSASGKQIAIYSSGSTEAQKLLFAHTTAGNLTHMLEAYFDTRIGPKRVPQSYMDIAKALGVKTDSILFLTDVLEEAAAAEKAGCMTVLLIRPGNAPLSPESTSFPCVTSFEEL